MSRSARRQSCARVSEFATDYLEIARPYLSRLTIAVLRMSASDLLLCGQVAYAKKLLEVTSLTTNQIALSAAFGTQRTFFRCFARHVGMTPEQYRRGYQMSVETDTRSD